MKKINKTDKTILLIAIAAILFIASIYFSIMYFSERAELLQANRQLVAQQKDEKILIFAKLFINKVLLGQGAVSFDDRLELENSVRNINDPEIFSEWQGFTKSKNDRESQIAAANLLNALFNKIYR